MAPVLLACPACRKRISSSAHSCPNCGELLTDQWETQGRNWLRRRRYVAWGILLSAAAIVVVYRAETANQAKPAGMKSATAITSDAVGVERPPQAEIKQAVNQALAASRQQPTARLDPAPVLAQSMPQAKQATGNIVKSRDAVVCTSLASAQLVFELAQAKREIPSSAREGCWHIPGGKEIMVLSVAGGYAFIVPMEQLNERAWTNVLWLEPK
jgi:hypothetical protein